RLTPLLTRLPARLLACLRTTLLARLLAHFASPSFTSVLATPGVASLRPISTTRPGSIAITCGGPIAISLPVPITCSGRAVTIASSRPLTITWAAAIGLEHLLPVLAAKILPRRLPGLDVGLGEFLAHVGVIVFHTVTMVRIVLPLREIVYVVAIEVVDVHVPVGHIDVAAAPVAVAPEGITGGNASRECDARSERSAGNVAVGRWEIVRRIIGIGPIPVHHGGLVVWNVDFVRRSRLDHDVLLLVFPLDRGRLLLSRFGLGAGPRASTQPLGAVQHLRLLVVHGVAEFLWPIELFAHHGQHARNLDQ